MPDPSVTALSETPPSEQDARAALSPALRRVLDDELKRGNRVVELEADGPFVQVLLANPLDLDAHRLPAEVDRFACGPREPGEPPLAGFGDDASGHTLAGPDAAPSPDAQPAKPPDDDPGAKNRRMSSEPPPDLEWHPDDSETVARLKRSAQRFKWKNPAAIRAVRDVMLALFALERTDEASRLASFLAARSYDGDADRWEPVESALGLLAALARGRGDEQTALGLAARLKEGGLDELRLEGALLDDVQQNAELQSRGSGPRRELELRWLSELLVLEAALGSAPDRAAAIAERKIALKETLD